MRHFPRKRFGQHFLVDESVIAAIVAAIAPRRDDRMVEIDPSVLPLHWRRGLALYYVGRYEDSAKQFERYFEQDKSDRENGIWRFYAQTKQYGIEEARRRLLPYVQPDRAPLPDVYDLCAGKLTVLKLEERLSPSGLPAAEQAKRMEG